MINVAVNDIDSHYEHVVAEGATITMPIEDAFYGYRRYEADDSKATTGTSRSRLRRSARGRSARVAADGVGLHDGVLEGGPVGGDEPQVTVMRPCVPGPGPSGSRTISTLPAALTPPDVVGCDPVDEVGAEVARERLAPEDATSTSGSGG